MKKHHIAAIIGGLCWVGVATLGIHLWLTSTPTHYEPQARSKEMQLAMNALVAGYPEKTQKILRQKKQEMEAGTLESQLWLDLFVRSSEQLKDTPQLLYIFEYNPNSFKNHEEASLLVAEALIAMNQPKKYEMLREVWQGREKTKARWFFLDVDHLLLTQRKEDALQMLNSYTFKENDHEKERLLKLSLINATSNPEASLETLSLAQKISPLDPEIRSIKGHLHHRLKHFKEAENHFILATELSDNNPHYKAQLLRFYIYQRNFEKAAQLAQESLNSPTNENIWVHALFMDKTVQPSEFSLKGLEPKEVRSSKLIEELQDIPNNEFLGQNLRYEEPSHQVIFWLNTLQALKENNYQEALSLLEDNFYQPRSFYPELELSLRHLLNYHVHGTLNLNSQLILVKRSDENMKGLFADIENMSKISPKNPLNWMKHKYAFTALLLEAGWMEAALNMLGKDQIPEEFNARTKALYAEALLQVRNPKSALNYLNQYKESTASPEILLVKAKTYQALGEEARSEKLLKEISINKNDIGDKAAFLLAQSLMNRKEYGDLKALIKQNNALNQSVFGKELLARVAVFQNNPKQALILYQSIEEDSVEAQSFLARYAFKQKDWSKAKILTLKLIDAYPTNKTLQTNLKKIEDQVSSKNGPQI